MSGEPLGVALVGCGMIGQIHADSLRQLGEDGLVRPVIAADPSAGAREAALRNCPFELAVADASAAIDHPDVEAVLVTAPTPAHEGLVDAVVTSGKALLCEKPLAPTWKQVTRICEQVATSGLTAQVGFHSRCHPIMNRLAATISSGELGKAMGYSLRDDQYWPTGGVVAGHSSWRSDQSQAGGGALLEHSIHSADLLCWLFGPPRRVHAFTRSMFGYDVEDVASLTIEHVSGVVGTLLTVFNGVRGREERRLEVFCEQGVLEVTTDFVVGAPEDSYLVQRPDRPPERPDLETMRSSYFESLGVTRRDFLFYTYLSQRQWVQAVGREEPASPGFDDALTAHLLVEAAYRSAASGAPVEASSIQR